MGVEYSIMSWKTNLLEFGVILIAAAIIGFFLYNSIGNTSFNSDLKIIIPWFGFFVIPLIYYGLIKVNINIGRK